MLRPFWNCTAFLEAVPSRRDRVALTTAYATGLRASEVVRLRIHDIDSSRMLIHVANGKGGKRPLNPVPGRVPRKLVSA
jgi:integrase